MDTSGIKVGYVGLNCRTMYNFSIKLQIYIIYFIFFRILSLCIIIVSQQYDTIIYVFISFRNLNHKFIHVFYFTMKLKTSPLSTTVYNILL